MKSENKTATDLHFISGVTVWVWFYYKAKGLLNQKTCYMIRILILWQTIQACKPVVISISRHIRFRGALPFTKQTGPFTKPTCRS